MLTLGSLLLVATFVLTASAWLRGAEYDEEYTLFLTAGSARPEWPDTAFPAGAVAIVQSGHATLAGIATDLRATDVHPPLYFWAVSLWREAFGPSLFAARMLSVLCGLVSLSLIGAIARRCAITPGVAMLLTLGCYGFVYTNSVARGFAAAQMLMLCGVALLLGRRPLLAGLCLGAACCCNYLAAFVAVAVMAASCPWVAPLTAVPFLALDFWFFAAQHGARPGQFPPFEVWPSLLRLAEYQIASVFGGLPLYVDGGSRIAVGAIVGLMSVALVLYVSRARPLNAGPAIRLVLAAAVATPIGLLLLGAVFDNTPIELRYLSFGLPFIALLIAWAWRALSCRGQPGHPHLAVLRAAPSRVTRLIPGSSSGTIKTQTRAWREFVLSLLLPVILAIQLASIAGLLLSPRTMQPARAAATAAARLAGDGIVLLPRGNDGVGIVGAFGIESPPGLPILLVSPTGPIADRIASYHRVVIAMLAQDRDSIATIPILRAVFASTNWRRVAIGSNVEVYERTDAGE
jgi:Dolichyl-phosphate-mannose-protein mannosyltransferase